MTLHALPQRRMYWSVKNGLYAAPAFGSRFGMSRKKFEKIMVALSFGSGQSEDKWRDVRPLVNLLTTKWTSVIQPGNKLTIDESMFAWYGKGDYQGGMPAIMKIKRKPKGVGCEIKNIADSTTNIMLNFEINEGKDEMAKKPYQTELGAGTATTLRLCEPWFHSGRIILGDSWFASVKVAEQLHNRGLYFMGRFLDIISEMFYYDFDKVCSICSQVL